MKITPDHLFDLSIRAARCGNTRAMAQAAQASGATCYTITEREAARVRREYGVEARSLSGYRPDQEIGRRTPVLLDVAVLPAIAEAWSAEVGAAEQRARQLTDELATSKAAHAADQRLLRRALAELERLRTTSLSDGVRELIGETKRLDRERQRLVVTATGSLAAANQHADLTARVADAAPALAAEVERLGARLAEVGRERDEAVATLESMLRDMAAVERMFPDEAPTSPPALAAEVERLSARLAEVERERDQACAMRRVAEQETRTVADHGQRLIDNARAEATEARLALAAEHGRQEGAPSSEWRWTGKVWFHPPTCMVVEPADRLWRLNPHAGDPRQWRLSHLGPMPARDAMKTADASS